MITAWLLDNGKEDGNYYSMLEYILRLYWDNGKWNGHYRLGFKVLTFLRFGSGVYRDIRGISGYDMGLSWGGGGRLIFR